MTLPSDSLTLFIANGLESLNYLGPKIWEMLPLDEH